MRKLITFLTICLLTPPICNIMAVDVSVVETFGTMPNIYNSEESTSLSKQMETRSGKSSQGTLSVWQYRRVRAKKNDLLDGNRAFLMDRSCTANNSAIPYLQTATDSPWEGGIKSVQFDWKQVNNDDDGQLLKLQVILKDTKKVVSDITEEISVEAGETYRENTQSYTSSAIIDSKLNTVQLVLYNKSRNHDDNADAAGRILVGPITITPYLLFRNKEVTLGTKQRGFVNTNLINNTDGGTIRYYSSATDVATINSETGVVTPISAGNAVITAKWEEEDLTTTYILHVEDGIIVENFGKIAPTGPDAVTEPWDGDLFEWAVSKVRRDANDTIGLNPRVQATWMRENTGYIQSSTDVEGGIKHIEFDWMQWSNVATTSVTVSYGGEDKVIDSKTDNTQFKHLTIDEDINCASNAVLKIANTSAASPNDRITIGAIKITPYLLYTTKSVTFDRSKDNSTTYTNPDLINNVGDEVEYSISSNSIGATINEGTGEVSLGGKGGEVTITAAWGSVSTDYTLHIIAKTEASFTMDTVFLKPGESVPANELSYTSDPNRQRTITYTSSNTSVATVDNNGKVSLVDGKLGQTTITASIEGTDNYSSATASYIICVTKSVTEEFSNYATSWTSATSGNWYGDICQWDAYKVRRKAEGNTDVISGELSNWLRYDRKDNNRSHINTKNLEGGIKAVSFTYARYGVEFNPDASSAVTGRTLKLKISAGEEISHEVSHENNSLADKSDGKRYTHLFNCKSNSQLKIENTSISTSDNDADKDNLCRILVGNVSITPFIYYTTKRVYIERGSNTYANNDIILNIDGEGGTLTYSSSNDTYASVNEEGVVTGKAVGTAIITATYTWPNNEGEVSTSYTVLVTEPSAIETFADVPQVLDANIPTETAEEATGSLCKWEYYRVRRNVSKGDTLKSGQSGWYTQCAPESELTDNYIQTKDAFEGGVKALYFDWRQFGIANGNVKMVVTIGEETNKYEMVNYSISAVDQNNNNDTVAIKTDWNITKNAQIKIENKSANGCIIIGDIHITPYLRYTQKKCTLDIRGDGDLTYINDALINNTSGSNPVFTLSNPSSLQVSIDNNGELTVANRYQTGDVTIQAAWSDVTTTYDLHIIGKALNSVSYLNKKVYADVNTNGYVDNSLEGDYDGTITYSSSNEKIATVDEYGNVTIVGVGQDTITATMPETDNYQASSASYVLYVRDANARKEQFSIVTANGVVGETLTPWAGDLFDWQAQYQVRRKEGDNIKEGTETAHLGTSIGIQNYNNPDPNNNSILQSKGAIEGGIKHLSFYWAQWGAANNTTRRIAVYAGDRLIGSGEHKDGFQGDEFLMGINHQVKSNQRLIFKNESYEGDAFNGNNLSTAQNSSRIVLGVIEITPYLYYADKAHTMHVGDAPYTHPLINNTGGNNITYSLVPNDSEVAEIDETGKVTVLKAGEVTIKATWNEESAGAYTTYRLSIKPEETAFLKHETFPNATTSTYAAGGNEIAVGNLNRCEWTCRYTGIRPDEDLSSNAAFSRAKRSTDSYTPHISSSTISGGINTLAFDWNLVTNEPNVEKWDICIQIKQGETTIEKHLTSDAGDVLENVHKRNSNDWKSYVISDINITGDFAINIENHSTIFGTYEEGNKGRFIIGNMVWESTNAAVTLADNANNTTVISNNDGQTVDVQLADRTIRTGGYNTLCLPFALSEQQLATSPLKDAKIYDFTDAYLSGTGEEQTLDIRFTKVNEMVAGQPYLVTIPANVPNPVFENVTIDKSETNFEKVGGNMKLVGTFAPKELPYSALFVVGNELYRVNLDANDGIRAFRAYFDTTDGSTLNANIRTRIVANEEVATDVVTVSGERLSVTGAQKVLRDGQLYLMYEGRMYDVRGALVK